VLQIFGFLKESDQIVFF